jgi:hypothetical protein
VRAERGQMQIGTDSFAAPSNDIACTSARRGYVVILLCGGTKKRQDRDIAMAHDRWVDYKKCKAEEK